AERACIRSDLRIHCKDSAGIPGSRDAPSKSSASLRYRERNASTVRSASAKLSRACCWACLRAVKVIESNSVTIPSKPPQASQRPSGEKATVRIAEAFPLNEATKSRVAGFQIGSSANHDPAARRLPSWLNAKVVTNWPSL